MDFHAAMETFAEAWVAANTPTAVNTDTQNAKPTQTDNLPTLVHKDPNKHADSHPPSHSTDSGSGAKSLPIHCVVEQTSGPLTFENHESSPHTTVELDSYAILPSTTLFSELVRAALMKLGYSSTEAMNSKGAVQIKNWKPLTFDVITNDTKATVDDILGELTQVATLRIRLCSQSKLSTTDDVKDKLLQLLLTQSQGLLVNSGCPIEKTLLSSISKGEMYSNLSPEVRRAFDKWYEQQLQKQTGKSHEPKEPPRPAHEPQIERPVVRNTHTPPSDLSTPRLSLTNNSPPSLTPPLIPHGKTRMRTSFDPEHEIPRLQKWFFDNQHPSREQMIHYLEELNRLDSRKGRRPLDLTNIIYWFKNARAAHRRASKNYDDNSFEMEEGLESSPSAVDNNLPYLPNKNAVYIVPYPFHGPFMSNNVSHDSKEPCDLSQSRKSSSSPVPSSSPALVKQEPSPPESSPVPEEKSDMKYHEEDNPKESENYENEKFDEQEKISEEDRSQSDNDEQMDFKCNEQREVPNGEVPIEEPQNFVTVKKEKTENSDNTCTNHLVNGAMDDEKRVMNEDIHPYANGVQNSESEDEEDEFMDTDEEDDLSKSNADESDSSHDANQLSIKREEEHNYRSSVMHHISHSQTANALHQPLHIPHFPHPLAMHYFPMNTHFMAQQTARFHQHHQQQQHHQQENHQNHQKSSPGNSHRKRRTRVFIDPMSEIPKLEKWFLDDTHPSSYMIDKYCEELNRSDYRQKFPKLEPKNVQLWFKNHRAKVKRMRISIN